MENIGQALLIAGAVLIGVLLLSVYNNSMKKTEVYTGVYTKTLEAQELEKYNADFQSNAEINLNMYEVVTLMNKALYINEAAGYNPNYGNYIKVNLKFKNNPGVNYVTINNTDFLGNSNFISGPANNRKFNYRKYQEAVYGLLNKYYDDDEKGPKNQADVFVMSIKTSQAGYVNEISFVQK